MKLTDFLGKQYGPGDLVIYGAMSGRSVNVVLGRVTDIYRVFYDSGNTFRWKRLADNEPVPRRLGHDGGDLGECDSGTRVKVQPLRGARWTQHHGRTRYADTRSGKGIDPDRGKGLPHVLKDSHYVFADGTEFDWAAEQVKWQQRHSNVYGGLRRSETFETYFRRTYHINYGEPGQHRYPLEGAVKEMQQLWWVSRQYQPWVEKVTTIEPVTLEITDNIVKWEGELPDEVPDAVS